MSRRFGYRNEEFFYFNTNREGKFPKRFTGKTVMVNAKSVANESPKEVKKIATPQDVLNDFLESTSVHGLQYFGKLDIKVGILGKILWSCAMLTGFVCLSLMVMQFLNRYRENPTITYVKSFTAPIFQVPFPAVTICPISPPSVRRQTKILQDVILPENASKELVMQFFKYGRRLVLPFSTKELEQIDKLQMFLDANKWSMTDFLRVLQPCEDIFESCWWNSERIDCDKLVKQSHSSYGLCCSYNYILEQYVGRAKTQPKIMPQRSVGFGPWSGLTLVIKKEVLNSALDDDDGVVNLGDRGIGLLVHDSTEYPGLNNNLYILQPGRNLEVSVQPTLIKKPVGMYHRNMEKKLVPMCLPDDENSLEYMPIYQYSNCYTDCRIKMMLKICGCLPFSYDYLTDHHRVDRCDTVGLACLRKNVESITIVKDTENENISCSCISPCNYVSYENLPNTVSQIHAEDLSFNNSKSIENAVLSVFMKMQSYRILETLPAADEIYLLASIGGIFSLFLGCSFLSLVEIIYFAGLMCRAIFLSRKRKIASRERENTRDDFIKRRAY